MRALVIFDFDGTIADSRRTISRCADATLAAVGRAPVKAERVEAMIGLPLRHIFEVLLGEDDPVIDEAVATYRARYPEVDRALTRPFGEMPELLVDLHRAGVRMAVATGKSTDGAHASIARLGLDAGLFEAVVGSDAVARPKPHPEMVLHILETLGVMPEDALVVGDTTFDVEMGCRAEVGCCGVTWGSHDEAALRGAGARWITHTRAELRELLLSHPVVVASR